MLNTTTVFIGNLKERSRLEDLGVDGRKILKHPGEVGYWIQMV
jgi:hypothetical protein